MGDSTMSANIHPSDRCKEFFNRVKMGKLLYCLAKINKTDDNETIEVFYCHGKDNTNDIDGWTCDDEKNHNVKKKHGKKPKRSQGEFETAVWEPFCQVVERELLETGGWAIINVEYKDKNGAWNDKSVQIMFSDDSTLDIKKKFLLGACNNNVAGVSGGFKNIQINSVSDLQDLEEVSEKMLK